MFRIKTVFEILQRILFVLTKKQKRKSIKIFIHMMIAAILELFSVSLMIPFMTILMKQDDMIAASKYKFVFDYLGITDVNSLFALIVVAFITVYIVKNVYLCYVSYLKVEYRAELQKELSERMLFSYMSRPYTYFLQVNSGMMMRGVNADSAGVYKMVDCFFSIIADSLTLLFLIIYLALAIPFLAVGLTVISIILVAVMVLGMKKPMKTAGEKQRAAIGKTNQCALQAINGAKEIFVMRKKDFFCEQYAREAALLKRANVVSGVLPTFPSKIVEVVFVGFVLIFMVMARKEGSFGGLIPQLSAFVFAAIKILPSVSAISANFSNVIALKPALDGAYENYKEAAEYESKREAAKPPYGREEYTEDHTLRIKNIWWKYEESKEYVLEDVSMEINEGESVALIGKSGAGKSTLADIVLGLLCPQEGSIVYGGRDIFYEPDWWSTVIGYVPQSVYLFDDTIRFNVAIGVPEDEIDDRKVWEALGQAQLKEFVEALPQGLDTVVGERGIRFSGGQRQRLAIARALYRNPAILILDEATSALDHDTETAVMEAINNLKGKKTMLIVAHRLTTVENCDKLYVVEGRGVIEKRDRKQT